MGQLQEVRSVMAEQRHGVLPAVTPPRGRPSSLPQLVPVTGDHELKRHPLGVFLSSSSTGFLIASAQMQTVRKPG